MLISYIFLLRTELVPATLAFGVAGLCGPTLIPLALVALVLVVAHAYVSGLFRGGPSIALRVPGSLLAVTIVVYLWSRWTGHGLTAYEADPLALIFRYLSSMSDIVASVRDMVLALLLSLPYLVGLRYLWLAGTGAVGEGAALRVLVLLGFYAVLAAFPAYAILRFNNTNAYHVVYLMWAAFLFPLGWVGLSALASGTAPPARALVIVCMALLVGAGGLAGARGFRNELARRSGEKFSVTEVTALANACDQGVIGYFTPPGERERVWWIPVESAWTALAECRFMRLNRTDVDESEARRGFWDLAAPMAYAQQSGIAWENSPAVMLGFAKAVGADRIAETAKHPIPEAVRPYLRREGQAGPVVLWRIAVVPQE